MRGGVGLTAVLVGTQWRWRSDLVPARPSFPQGYTNPLFWSRLSSAVLPRLASLDPNTLPAMVLALHTAQQLPPAAASSSSSASSSPGPEASGAAPGSQPQAALARQALLLLTAPGVLAGLRPARLACAAHALAAAGPCPGVGVLPDERVMGELQVGWEEGGRGRGGELMRLGGEGFALRKALPG